MSTCSNQDNDTEYCLVCPVHNNTKPQGATGGGGRAVQAQWPQKQQEKRGGGVQGGWKKHVKLRGAGGVGNESKKRVRPR